MTPRVQKGKNAVETPGVIFIKKVMTHKNKILGGIALLVVISSICFGIYSNLANRALEKAEELSINNYHNLAIRIVEPYKNRLLGIEKGCRLLIRSAAIVKDQARLAEFSETCLSQGVPIPESFMGIALSKRLVEDYPGALNYLFQGAALHPKSAELWIQVAETYEEMKETAAAGVAYLDASALAPANNEITKKALKFFVELAYVDQAKQMAQLLQATPAHDVETYLLMAKAFDEANDNTTARSYAMEALVLLNNGSLPSPKREEITQKYRPMLEKHTLSQEPDVDLSAKTPGGSAPQPQVDFGQPPKQKAQNAQEPAPEPDLHKPQN